MQKTSKKIILKGSGIQTAIIALDFYSRIWIGQYKEILELSHWHMKDILQQDIQEQIIVNLQYLRMKIYPNLGDDLNGSYGIFNPEVELTPGIAYNMQQVLRYTYAYAEHPEGGYTVNFSKPIATGQIQLPLCTIERNADEIWEITLDLSGEYCKILKMALDMYKSLLLVNIKAIFAQCTGDVEAMEYAEKVENILKKFTYLDCEEEVHDIEKILAKI